MLVLWAGAGGGSVGTDCAAVSSWSAAAASPSRRWRLAALGGSLLLRADPRRLRPFRVGAVALSLGVLSLLGSAALDHHALRHGGGYAGNGVHAAAAAVAGEPGALVSPSSASSPGLLLLSGASAYVLLGHSATGRAPLGAGRRARRGHRRSVPMSEMPAAVRTRRKRTAHERAAAARPRGARYPDGLRALAGAGDDVRAARAARGATARHAAAAAALRPDDRRDEPTGEITAAHGRRRASGVRRARAAGAGPVSNYRLPDRRCSRAGRARRARTSTSSASAPRLLAALTEHGVECRLIGTVSGPRVTR